MRNWLIYALGGGWGHLTRALALARQLEHVRHNELTLHVLTNSSLPAFLRRPDARVLVRLPDSIMWHEISPRADRATVMANVRQTLQAVDFETVIIDTFPRGIAGELADWLPTFAGRRVLIHRRLHPRYITTMPVGASIDCYDLVLVPGESANFSEVSTAHRTPPWLIANQDDLLSREEALRALRASECRLPVVVFLASGKPDEVRQTVAAATEVAMRHEKEWQTRVISPNGNIDGEVLAYWPAACLHAGIDLLVGAGGYNTVFETRTTGVPLLAVARPRMYDQQQERLFENECISLDLLGKPGELANRIRRRLAHRGRRPDSGSFLNGAALAARRLLDE